MKNNCVYNAGIGTKKLIVFVVFFIAVAIKVMIKLLNCKIFNKI